VADCRSSTRFTLESLDRCRIALQLFWKERQRDLPIKPQIFGTVHNTNDALAELVYDAIVRNGLLQHDVNSADARLI
jgi:hypothetical protein